MIFLYVMDVGVAVTEQKDLAAGGKRNCIVKTTIVTELTHTQVIDEVDATARTWVGQTCYLLFTSSCDLIISITFAHVVLLLIHGPIYSTENCLWEGLLVSYSQLASSKWCPSSGHNFPDFYRLTQTLIYVA